MVLLLKLFNKNTMNRNLVYVNVPEFNKNNISLGKIKIKYNFTFENLQYEVLNVRFSIIALLIILLSFESGAQQVGINTGQIDSSAVFEIKSDSFGILIPRLDSLNIQNITNPAKSLLLYQKDGKEGFKFYDGTEWKNVIKENIPIVFIHPDSLHIDSIQSYIMNLSRNGEAIFHYDTLSSPRQVWFWNGSITVKIWDSKASGVKTLPNYSALRSLNNYMHDIVYVSDWTYTGPDGNQYNTIGGIFKRVNSGVENGGTLIVSSDSIRWEREWDKINTQPEWWECGGYDHNGVMYTDKNTSAYGIYNERDRINAAINVGKKLQLKNEKIYDVDIPLQVNGHIVEMNKATIRRKPFNATILTSVFGPGQTSVNVENSSNFRVGQQIIICDNDGPYNGLLNDNSHNAFIIILNISENTLSLQVEGEINATFLPGDSVRLITTIFNVSEKGGQFHNGNFIGNKKDYPVRWWNQQYIIAGGAFENEDMFVAKNLYIKNNTGECIGISSGLVENIILENSTGSLVHIGSQIGIPKEKLGGHIKNCKAINVCQSNEINSVGGVYINHNEGVITFSNNCKGWFIEDLRVHTSGTGVLGNIDDNDRDITLTDSYAENCQFITPFIGGNENGTEGNIVLNIKILNCYFENCGMLHGISAFQLIKDLIIRENQFINTQIHLSHQDGLVFDGNRVVDNGNFIWDYENIYGNINFNGGFRHYFSLIENSPWNNVKITNNIFLGNKIADINKYMSGIYIPLVSIENNNQNNGFFSNYRNLEIKGNHILYFPRGVAFSTNSTVIKYKEYFNIKIFDNTIKMNSSNLNNQWAINVLPGMEVYNNTIYGQHGGTQGNDTYVVYISGLFIGSVNLYTNKGAHFYSNKILGGNNSCIRIGNSDDDYNCFVYSNLINQAVLDLTNGESTIFNNVVMGNTNVID